MTNSVDEALTAARRTVLRTVGLAGLATTLQIGTVVGQSDDKISTTYGFETNLEDWTVVEGSFDRTDEFAFEGSYAAGVNSEKRVTTVASLELPDSIRLRRLSFVWRESQSSFGGGVLVRNASGNMECFAGSDNPEWVVIGNNDTDGPGSSYIGQSDGTNQGVYDRWIRTEIEFDWNANTFRASFTDTETGDTSTEAFPLNEGDNVDQIELHGYTDASYEPGSEPATGSCHMHWDEIEVESSTRSETQEQTDSTDSETTDGNETETNESVPGFGIGSGLAALGAISYILKRRLTDDSE